MRENECTAQPTRSSTDDQSLYRQNNIRQYRVEQPDLTLCILGNVSCFCCRLLTYFKINFFKKFFQAHYQSVKHFRSRSGPTFCRS